jgi:hypothetical protein
MEDSKAHDHNVDARAEERGFLTEDQMIDLFTPIFGVPKPARENKEDPEWWWEKYLWYSKQHHPETVEHHKKVPPGMIFTCDDLADIWIERWFKTPKDINPFTNPSSSNPTREYPDMDANSLVLADDRADVYLVSASAFQEPDFRRGLIFREASILVPVYFVVASSALFPSLEKKPNGLFQEVENDLKGVEIIHSSLDGKKLYGCTVVRKDPLRINNIPKNNIFDIPEERLTPRGCMDVYHGGFWLLTEKLDPGDHLLYFQAKSANYEMEVKMLITALY